MESGAYPGAPARATAAQPHISPTALESSGAGHPCYASAVIGVISFLLFAGLWAGLAALAFVMVRVILRLERNQDAPPFYQGL